MRGVAFISAATLAFSGCGSGGTSVVRKKGTLSEKVIEATTGPTCSTYGLCTGGRQASKLLTRDEYVNSVIDLFGVPYEKVRPTVLTWAPTLRVDNFDVLSSETITAKAVENRILTAESLANLATDFGPLKACIDKAGGADKAWSGCKASLVLLMRRAFRRATTSEDSARLETVYGSAYAAAKLQTSAIAGLDPALEGIRAAAQFILSSSDFLFHNVSSTGATKGERALNIMEVAERLSFALSVSVPDDALIASAASGALSNKGELETQAKRLLASSTARPRLIHNWFAKWFNVDSLRDAGTGADSQLNGLPLPDYYREFELVFNEILTKNLPVRTWLNPKFTFVNAALAERYGLTLPKTGLTADGFGKVATPQRGSVLQMGAFHYATRAGNDGESNPVNRGLTVLSGILCSGVKSLSPADRAKNDELEKGFIDSGNPPRNVIEKWDIVAKKSPGCLDCHAIINPMGFPLEAYSTDGRLRATYASNGTSTEYHGTFGKTPIDSPLDLVTAVTADPRYFSCLNQKAFNYLVSARPKANRKADANLTANAETGMRDLILEIIRSAAFLKEQIP